MASSTLPDTSHPAPDIGATERTADRRVLDGALRCIARWGVAKTTLDDVAREAGCSRATIYRLFAGGKDALLSAVVRTEIDQFDRRLAARLEAAGSLEDLLVAGITEAHRSLRDHAALQFVLAHEPERVLPNLTFHRLELVLAAATAFAAPHLAPYVGEDDARRVADWVARIILSYTLCPSDGYDLGDEDDARRFVTTFILPGIATRVPSPTTARS